PQGPPIRWRPSDSGSLVKFGPKLTKFPGAPSIPSALGQFGLVLAIEFDGFLYDFQGFVAIEEALDPNRLVLQHFVILEEATELLQAVRGKFGDGLIDVELGIVGVDGDDLVVGLALIEHLH